MASLWAYVTKARRDPSRSNPVQHNTKLAQRDALINARSSRCCIPVCKRPESITKNDISAVTTPGFFMNSGWEARAAPVGMKQTLRASHSVVSLASFSIAATFSSVFSATAPLAMPSSTLSVVGLSSLVFQPAGLAMRIPIAMLRMMATTSLTTMLMMWLTFENPRLVSRSPRVPAIHRLAHLSSPCILLSVSQLVMAGRKMERLATEPPTFQNLDSCTQFHRLVASRSLVGSSKNDCVQGRTHAARNHSNVRMGGAVAR